MSVARDEKGRVFVLDQVNGRIVRHDAKGDVDGTIGMKQREPQDLAIGADGSIAVLDRIGDKTLAVYDESGTLRGEIPLEGEGVGDSGLVTGVSIDGNDVYVEREHGPLVKIGDLAGHPANPRTEIPGRPSRDGKSFLNAGITDAAGGRAYVSAIDRATNDHRFTRELRLGAEIHSIVLLDSDKSGTIYFAAALHDDPSEDWVLLECMEPSKGALIGSAVLPPNTMPEETFRDLTVLDGGGVIYAHRTEQGVSYERYDCN